MRPESDAISRRIKRGCIKGIVMLMIIMTLASSLIYTYCTGLYRYGERTEFLLETEDDNALDIYDLFSLKEMFGKTSLSFYRKAAATISNGRIQYNVDVYFTDTQYNQFDSLKILKGVYFTEFHMEYGRKAALIGEETALRFFLTSDVIGNSIFIGNEKYNIIGVYDESISYLTFPAKSRNPKVFVPFTSSPRYSEERVDGVFLAASTEYHTANSIMDNIFIPAIKTKIVNYSIEMYNRANQAVFQIFDLAKFVIGLLVLYAIFSIMLKLLRVFIEYIKEKRKSVYLTHLLRDKVVFLIVPLVAMISILLTFCVFRFIVFELYIPSEYLPPDNIFDFAYYKDLIIEKIIEERFSYGIDSDFKVIFKWVQVNLFLLSAALILCFFFLKSKISILPASEIDKMFIISCGAALLIGYIFGALLAVNIGLTVSFFWKWYVFIVLFLFLFLFKRLLEEGALRTGRKSFTNP